MSQSHDTELPQIIDEKNQEIQHLTNENSRLRAENDQLIQEIASLKESRDKVAKESRDKVASNY